MNTREADLFDGIRAGDRGSLDALYTMLLPRLMAVLTMLGADRPTAEDIAQDTFAKIWEQRATLPSPQSPASYILAMARNRWLNEREHRAVWRRIAPELRPPVSSPTDPERSAALLEAVRQLDVDLRDVLTLHRHGGLSYAQIAETLDVSVKTVEGRMKRAFDALRVRLAPLLERDAS